MSHMNPKKALTTRGYNGTGFPKTYKMKHRYSQDDQLVYSAGAGVPAVLRMSCNGLFDPDPRVGGHQPLYFDQMMALYNHYTVIGAKLTLRVSGGGNTNPGIYGVLFINDDTTTTPTSITGQSEQVGAKTIQMGWNSNETKTMRIGWSLKKAFGKTSISQSQFKGTAAANPTEQQFFNFSMISSDLGVTGIGIPLYWTIEFIVVYSELKDIAQS